MNLGFPEMIFIFLLALIIFGPKKLPEIGRQIGKFMAEFKRASNEFKWQIEAEIRQLEAETNQVKSEVPKFEPPYGSILNSGASRVIDATPAETAASVVPASNGTDHSVAAQPEPLTKTNSADA